MTAQRNGAENVLACLKGTCATIERRKRSRLQRQLGSARLLAQSLLTRAATSPSQPAAGRKFGEALLQLLGPQPASAQQLGSATMLVQHLVGGSHAGLTVAGAPGMLCMLCMTQPA